MKTYVLPILGSLICGLYFMLSTDTATTKPLQTIPYEHKMFTTIQTTQSSYVVVAPQPLTFVKKTTSEIANVKDTTYTYTLNAHVRFDLTERLLRNGDYMLFYNLHNEDKLPVRLTIYEQLPNVKTIERFDKYALPSSTPAVFGQDRTSYPTGVLIANEQQRMLGQAYQSRQYIKANSTTRELLDEYEASNIQHDKLVTTLQSRGNDRVDSWQMVSAAPLFKSEQNLQSWMRESAENRVKRNKWYTQQGPISKMATTVEPVPLNGEAYGRNLLLVKEDRAITLYETQGDRYFENIVANSFANLALFKGDDTYWASEVTSTYLKGLYGIEAPFIDTRFNEQIALYYLRAGEAFGITAYDEPLRNYANLLVTRRYTDDIIPIAPDAFFISDYFTSNEGTTAHSSMNHLLGSLHILLKAYEAFDDSRYLDTATAIYNALAHTADDWIRPNGDIWYRINAAHEFAGNDYARLTAEDFATIYDDYTRIDPTKLALFERFLASKTDYLNREQLGYTEKMKNLLQQNDLQQYIPAGGLHIDAQ